MALADTLKTDMGKPPVTAKPKAAPSTLPKADFPSADPVIKSSQEALAATKALAEKQAAQRTELPGVLKGFREEEAAKIKPLEEGLTFKPDMNYMRDISNVFMMVGMMGAFIGGKGSASAAANAQAALTGMMQGLVKGNDTEFQRQKTIFDENSKYLSKQVEDIRNTFKEYRERAIKDGIAEGGSEASQRFNTIGADVMKAQVDKVGADAASKSAETLFKTQETVAEHIARMNEAERVHQDAVAQRNATLASRGGSSLDPETIKFAAQGYLVSGSMPQMAWGDKASRAMILNQAAKIASDAGLSGYDVKAIQAGYGASKSALMQLSKVAAATSANEKTLEKNMDVALKASDDALVSALPFLNKWYQSGSTKLGAEGAPAYAAALVTVADMYAKILSGATGAAPASDASRRQALELIQTGFNKGQVKSVFDIIRTEARNRVDSNQEVSDAIKKGISGAFEPSRDQNLRPANAPEDAKQAPDGHWYTKNPDGKTFTRWD